MLTFLNSVFRGRGVAPLARRARLGKMLGCALFWVAPRAVAQGDSDASQAEPEFLPGRAAGWRRCHQYARFRSFDAGRCHLLAQHYQSAAKSFRHAAAECGPNAAQCALARCALALALDAVGRRNEARDLIAANGCESLPDPPSFLQKIRLDALPDPANTLRVIVAERDRNRLLWAAVDGAARENAFMTSSEAESAVVVAVAAGPHRVTASWTCDSDPGHQTEHSAVVDASAHEVRLRIEPHCASEPPRERHFSLFARLDVAPLASAGAAGALGGGWSPNQRFDLSLGAVGTPRAIGVSPALHVFFLQMSFFRLGIAPAATAYFRTKESDPRLPGVTLGLRGALIARFDLGSPSAFELGAGVEWFPGLDSERYQTALLVLSATAQLALL